MNKYVEVFLAAACFAACAYIALFGKPQPPIYSGWERDAGAALMGAMCLWFTIPSWAAYPELRVLLVVALLLALTPSIVTFINAPFIQF